MDARIVDTALINLLQVAGIQGYIRKYTKHDLCLEFYINGTKFQFVGEVKQEVRAYQIDQLPGQSKAKMPQIIVANRIFPGVKSILQEKRIPYLEANGNFFLSQDNFYILIDTARPFIDVKRKGRNRAFTKTGLKVVYFLLQNKDALNWTQREIADEVGVSLGTIPQVINGLKDSGYIFPLDRRNYIWKNRMDLLRKWIDSYEIELRPKLVRHQYKISGDWRDIRFSNNLTVWGGEPGADLLTNHLRPEKYTIYTKEKLSDLIRKYKLIPDPFGEAEVLEMFWSGQEGKIASPMLVYTDLILEGGKRNIETAERIFNDYVKPII